MIKMIKMIKSPLVYRRIRIPTPKMRVTEDGGLSFRLRGAAEGAPGHESG